MRRGVFFSVGGTGGHIVPASLLASYLFEKTGQKPLFVGVGIAKNRYLDEKRFSYVSLKGGPLSLRRPFTFLLALFKLAVSVGRSVHLLRKERPEYVVGFGSFHSLPLLIACRIINAPFFLFEPNALPGRVTLLFSKKAYSTFLLFDEAKAQLRAPSHLVKLPRDKTAFAASKARAYYGLEEEVMTLLVFGGSQGAVSINTLFLEVAKKLAQKKPFQVIHLTGQSTPLEDEKRVKEARKYYQKIGVSYFVSPYENEMDKAWQAASLAICRGGAITLSEGIEFHVPMLIIPYPFAKDDHQKINAKVIEKIEGGMMIEEKGLTPDTLCETLLSMMEEKNLSKRKKALTAYSKEKRGDMFSLIDHILDTRKR